MGRTDAAARGGAGVPPSTWTAELVAERLIEAFRSLPHVPLYASRELPRAVPPLDERTRRANEALQWVDQYLADDPDGRLFLLVWCRARTGGISVRSYCIERGRNRDTFDRRRKAALAAIAAGLNRDGAVRESPEAAK